MFQNFIDPNIIDQFSSAFFTRRNNAVEVSLSCSEGLQFLSSATMKQAEFNCKTNCTAVRISWLKYNECSVILFQGQWLVWIAKQAR